VLDGLDRIPDTGKNLYLLHSVKKGFGAYPCLNPVGTEGYFVWGKTAGA
jgi:hypothetical protein